MTPTDEQIEQIEIEDVTIQNLPGWVAQELAKATTTEAK